jgi:DNA (cytosine-5)-methyltransferase 1
MGEIRSVVKPGLVAASTFSGCGGSSLGYRMAGFEVRYANEFVEAARDTYLANCEPYTFVDARDIREVSGAEIVERCGGRLDLLDGSPPCSDFSVNGKGDKGWGKVKTYSDREQRVDDLFFQFARVLGEAQPRVFVAENVKGLVSGTAKGYFKLILAALRDCGYRVQAKVLNASWLGVPQARERLIFVGVREDQAFEPVHPKPLPYRYTVRDAIGEGLIDGTVDPEDEHQLSIEPYSIYPFWLRTKPGNAAEGRFNLMKLHPDRPSRTIVATGGSTATAGPVHWSVPRKFTLLELRRLGGFPDDFVLTGKHQQRYERIGRAVPPVMMSHVAAGLRDELLAHG